MDISSVTSSVSVIQSAMDNSKSSDSNTTNGNNAANAYTPPPRRRYRPARAFASINWRKAPDARYASRNLEIVAGVFRLRADARPRNDRTHQPSSSL